MRLIRHPSLIVADRVLKKLRRLLSSKHPGITLDVKLYANCREQGYYITNLSLSDLVPTVAVSFSENRNSDDIRVWYGPWRSFDNSGIPSEESLSSGQCAAAFFVPGTHCCTRKDCRQGGRTEDP